MKTITTGTKITFTETGDKFELIQTSTGFDVKRIKLSKNITPEPYTFQELLDLYEAGKITINGFEEGDSALVRSILTNYIHQTNLQEKLKDIEQLKMQITELTNESSQLKTTNQELIAANEKLTTENKELENNNTELAADNKKLSAEITTLKATNEQLNSTIEAMEEK